MQPVAYPKVISTFYRGGKKILETAIQALIPLTGLVVKWIALLEISVASPN